MKVATFFENFELLTDASNVIVKLREIILQLAVSGKLVPQDPNDEPSSASLAKLEVKKNNNKQPVDLETVAYTIPDTWQWVRLGEVAEHCLGKMLDKQKNKGKPLPYLRNLNVRWFDFDLEDILEMPFERHEFERFEVKSGDVLICEGGEPGRAAVWTEQVPNMKFQKALHRVRPSEVLYNHFLVYCLLLDSRTRRLEQYFTGATFKHFTGQELARYVFPLPPLEEQKRIVEKCDRLFILCDEIEKRQQQRQESLLKMNEGAISQLLAAQNPDEFQLHWQRVCNNFDLLYSIPETIPKLRQAILQLAFQGKLVPQISSEEPVNLLLERDLREKQKSEQQQSATTEDFFEQIEDDEFFFDLPYGWSYTRLGSICSLLSGYAFKSNSYVPTSKNQVIRLGNVKNDVILLDQSPVFISDELARENEKFLIRQGDLLITMTGTKNKRDFCFTAIVDKKYLLNKKLYLNQRVGCIRLVDSVCTELINIFLKSNTVVDFLLATATGTANQANIGVTALRNLPIPLPPLAEQKRIVVKVDSLLSLCDALETKLKASRDSSTTLMEVAAKQLLTA